MNRRGFLQAMLAAGAAPAIVKAVNLMPLFVRKEAGGLLVPEWEEIPYVSGMTYAQITREALRILHGNMEFVARVNRDFGNAKNLADRIIVRRPAPLFTKR